MAYSSVNHRKMKTYLFYFLHEFLSSLMLFFAFFPISVLISDNSYLGWIYHFLCVIVTDILSMGACVNPAVILALFIYGKVSFDETLIRLFSHIVCGLIVWHSMQLIIPNPYFEKILGPSPAENTPFSNSLYCECGLTFLLSIAVFISMTMLRSVNVQRIFIAIVLRLLIQLGGPWTGASMNPMIALAWGIYHLDGKLLLSYEFVSIYILSPIVGCSLAALSWSIAEELFSPSVTSKTSNIIPKQKIKQK